MVNTCAGRTQQDASSNYFRLGFVSVCGTVTARHMVPRVVQDIFRTAPADILAKELPDIMKVLTKIGDESLLRADLLENIPNIAAQAVESSTRVAALNDVIGDYLIPLVVRNLGCSDTGADKAAQTTLIQLIERGFVTKFQAEIKICPSILALTKMEGQLDVNTGAVTLMSKLAPLLGRDITERIFLKRFTELCSSQMFYVRKLSASHFGHYCAVVGKDAFEKTLLPCYLSLCQDEIWGVRKSCAEVIMFISCMCPPDLRKTLLGSAFTKLLQDECRWVKMSAFQTLGAFISTFADPPLTRIGYNSSGDLVMFNHIGHEFQPGGAEGFSNPSSILMKDDMPFFSLVDADLIGVIDERKRPGRENEGINKNEPKTADESKETVQTDDKIAKQVMDDQETVENAFVGSKETLGSEGMSFVQTLFDNFDVRKLLDDKEDQQKPAQETEGTNNDEQISTDGSKGNVRSEDQTPKQDTDDQKTIEKAVVDSREKIEIVVSKENMEIEEKPIVKISDNLSMRQSDSNLENKIDNTTIVIEDKAPTVTISEFKDQGKHEDDLLSYNQYNYWYISPPEIELDGLAEVSGTLSGFQYGSTSLDVMTSHLEDLYATISLNDSSDDGQNKSIQPSSDNTGDNLDSKSSEVNTVNSSETTTEELKEPSELPQKIVPQNLIDYFVSMAHCEKSFDDVDFSFHCAYALPAVILTLGEENWPLLKDTVHVLAGHMSYKVRRTVASSLHEIASILGPEIATENLSSLFEGFLKDLDEVRIGILKHLSQFLQLISPEKRVIFLPKLGEFLRVDNVCNWRFQETLAEQLTLAVNLFRPLDIVKHIGLYAQALMLYNVAAVRQAAMILVTEIVRHINKDHGLAASYLSVIAERFAHSKKWKPRQTFSLLCAELLKQDALDSEEFASVMLPHLLDLSWDPVANVRLVVANCIVKHIIINEYFTDPSNDQFESLDNVLRRLQADKDRDVRMSAEYPAIYH